MVPSSSPPPVPPLLCRCRCCCRRCCCRWGFIFFSHPPLPHIPPPQEAAGHVVHDAHSLVRAPIRHALHVRASTAGCRWLSPRAYVPGAIATRLHNVCASCKSLVLCAHATCLVTSPLLRATQRAARSCHVPSYHHGSRVITDAPHAHTACHRTSTAHACANKPCAHAASIIPTSLTRMYQPAVCSCHVMPRASHHRRSCE